MAGADYSGFGINFKKKMWTNLGYIKNEKKTVSWHKRPDEEFTILEEATDECPMGIAQYGDWFVVYGQNSFYVNGVWQEFQPRDHLKAFLEKNPKQYRRHLATIDQILKKERCKHTLINY